MDARHSNNEATAESVNAHELVSEVQGDAVSIIHELNTIDEVRDQMTLEEEEEIYGDSTGLETQTVSIRPPCSFSEHLQHRTRHALQRTGDKSVELMVILAESVIEWRYCFALLRSGEPGAIFTLCTAAVRLIANMRAGALPPLGWQRLQRRTDPLETSQAPVCVPRDPVRRRSPLQTCRAHRPPWPSGCKSGC
ncbi:Pyridoxal biosynthesis lyase pdxS [Gracilaria domingensis]|nr:Pyridoxal biosynthesis lyase pdxS [Gracilaria domingensis]